MSSKSDYFKKVNREIDHYKEQKAKKTVTLNKEKFLKEREELDTDKEQEKMFDDMTDPSRPVYDMNGYGKEALDIAVDYLDLLGANRVAVGQRRRCRRTAVAGDLAVTQSLDSTHEFEARSSICGLRSFSCQSGQSAARRRPAPSPPAAPRSSPRAPARATCA